MCCVKKTSVYLTDRQKRGLERAAQAAGWSEADLIREGVELVSARYRTAQPTLPHFDSGQPDLAAPIERQLEGFGEA
jgi:hypothetical protein